MILSNLHTHTLYCDGKDSPEELILKAIELNFSELGFSGHSYTFFDESYCMSKENTIKYISEINHLKEKYKNKIVIKLGIEQDYFSTEKTDVYDYVIGSVHYVKKDGKFLAVDNSEKEFVENVEKYYNGDFYAFCEDYYKLVGDLYNKTKCDIIGHFDLVTKFNQDNKYFDENNERYKKSYISALKKLLKNEVIFEINYGAVTRGYKTKPYPNEDIISIIKESGKKIIKTTDCHDKEKLNVGLC